MKIRESLAHYHYFIYALCFGDLAWVYFHRHAVGETILYSIAFAAGLFLTVLPQSIWDGKKIGQAAGQ